MDKRTSRQITLYSILFLVMLLFAGVTFFLGLNVGVNKTEEKYAHLFEDTTVVENYQYQQQDLVTFYLTTYSAYSEFQNQWFNSIYDIGTNRVSNPANVFAELASKAKKQAEEASLSSMQGYGLLDAAQQSYIRSLNSFEKAAKEFKRSTDNKSASEALTIITNDNNYKNAIEQALKAQTAYFEAMHKWSASVDPNIAATFDSTVSQPISTWDKYPLIIKMNIVTKYLDEQIIFKNLLPQDVVSRIDEFITSDQANQLGLTQVSEVLNLLLTTDAIRQGDYQQYKGTMYDNEFLPKIPFFHTN